MPQGAMQMLISIVVLLSDPIAERYRLLQWDRLRPHTCSCRLFATRDA